VAMLSARKAEQGLMAYSLRIRQRKLRQRRISLSSATAQSQKIAFVRGLPLFADVSPGDSSAIISSACQEHFRRRQTIFCAGDPVEHVAVLLSGWVKIKQAGPRGNEVILRLTGIGEVVGAFGCLSDHKHRSTAQTVRPCTALVWDAATFDKLLERFPFFRRNTIRALDERLEEMEQRFGEVSTESVGSRLSSELIRLSKRFACAVNGQQEICLSRRELAQLTGTTLATVSRQLCHWQALGIVNIGRKMVQVCDVDALT
jgi:CRP/FNR family transcriptional regulator, nitrogen oxide reductase regulator